MTKNKQKSLKVIDQNGGVKQQFNMDGRFDLAIETGTLQPAAAVESITV